MQNTNHLVVFATTTAIALSACDRGVNVATARGSLATESPRIAINEIMANPRAAPDERGEWIELYNLDAEPADLHGWTIASANDHGITIDRRVVIPGQGFVVLARDGSFAENGGVSASYVYDQGLALGNGADWLAIRAPNRQTIDSVAWTSTVTGASRALRNANVSHANVSGAPWATSTTRFGAGDLGTPGRMNEGAVPPAARGGPLVAAAPSAVKTPTPPANAASQGPPPVAPGPAPRDSTLVIRVLDVGQGDAIFIENGGSRVLIDGGPEPARFGRLLDELGVADSTIDAVILTHEHYDHYAGLRELFRSRRRISVRYLWENKDPYSNVALAELRDSIIARARRHELDYRDTDDPCGTGAPSCAITLHGGARLYLLRPDPTGNGPNNRSAAVRLVAPDSSAFTMWLAGDAEQQEIAWFDDTDYDRVPGMRANILKGDHHGSCDGISPRYLDLVRPEMVVMSLAAVNDYGFVHSQTLDLLRGRRIPWYRTDQNGTITITVPRRGKYAIAVERGGPSMRGPTDRRARECGEGRE